MARVLILEDEAVLRASMARGLRKMEGLEVVEAATMAEALRQLDAARPDLVLSDIDLPDRSGIEILGELGKRGMRVPVVFISAFLKAYGAQIPRHADVEVLEKPVELEALRRLVAERVGAGPAEPSPFTVADYLQLSCMAHRSVSIRLQSGGRTIGEVRVVEGEVWSAQDEAGRGVQAFRRLVFSDGTVECRALAEAPGERNLETGWEQLLMEAARLKDESGRRAAPVPAVPAATPAAAPAAAAATADFDRIWDEAVAALLAKDHRAALRLFLAAARLRPGDRKVEANLARLKEMGYKVEGEASRSPETKKGT